MKGGLGMTSAQTRCVASVLILTQSLGVGRAQPADPRAALLAEYERPAAALLDHYKAVRMRYETRVKVGNDRESVTTTIATFDREHYLLDNETHDVSGGTPVGEPGPRSIQGRNQLYTFDLTDRGPNGFALRSTRNVSPREFTPWLRFSFPYADPWRKRTYLDLFREAETTIHAVRRDSFRGTGALAVDAEYGFDDHQKQRRGRGRSVYYFDPAARWVCLGERSVSPAGSTEPTYESVYLYSRASSWPVPTREELWELRSGQTGPGKLISATDILDYNAIPPLNEADFRLSAYGLPEPVGVEWPQRRSAWLWLAWAGAVWVVVSVLLVLLRRRAARRPAAAPATPS